MLDFLHASGSPDVELGTMQGFTALARSWRVLSHLFPDIHVQLYRVEQTALSTDSLLASTTTTITITANTLYDVFPHLVDDTDDEDENCARIALKLLGQRLRMDGSVWFDWDRSSRRVVRLYSQADMLSPLLQLRGNLEDVSITFSKALVTPDFNLVS
ncbi:unnamed protein product [Phytophthora lilii]|uniref:Unnamed protein product n=1 Tax=Phytophthora lilii TaxID=2077276 RepID=A0A9W6WME1_9STRA|nr:unnamed protein product [Phytophthora lilii]